MRLHDLYQEATAAKKLAQYLSLSITQFQEAEPSLVHKEIISSEVKQIRQIIKDLNGKADLFYNLEVDEDV